MIEEKDFPKIRDYVIKILPEILRQEPEIVTTIEGILAEQFPRRDEFARMLDELTQHRQETHQSFEQIDQRFEQVDQRFEQVDQRFEQVDQRFEQVDQRFDDMHQTQLGMKRDIAKIQHGQERLIEKIDGQEKWLKLVIGDLRNEKGQTLEDLVAAALRYGLKNPDINPENIRLRQKLVDTEGQVFKPGFSTEIDLIAEDGTLTVFEVKASAKPGDVYLFSMKVELVAVQNPDKQALGVFISLEAGEEVKQQCAEYGLALVD